jgi:hypothetical protein
LQTCERISLALVKFLSVGRNYVQSMNIRTVNREFERHLKARYVDVPTLTPSAGVDAMLAFYCDVRATDCKMEESGDMLLYQWGTYDWGHGLLFELDVTRQLMRQTGEDENIWQLGLTFRFQPDETLKALGSGNKWCESLLEVEDFASFVRTHAAVAAVGARTDAAVELRYEQAG